MRRSLAAAVLLLALSLLQAPLRAGSSVYRIKVAGMVCSFCAQGIEKRLRSLPGTESVRIDLSHRLVEVTPRPGVVLDQAALRKAIRDAGYDVRSIEAPAPAAR
ncbi:MAG: heavy metal-associated domain-containing protein [Cyanobacteriota bacterium]|nr:heavy metal-associated domain-containing protein [Cyanobacteriota bacterium]